MSLTRREHAILVYLEAHAGATTPEIASALQYTADQIGKAIQTLYSRRLVGRQNALGLDSPRGKQTGEPWRWYSARRSRLQPPLVACTDADGATAVTGGALGA